MSQAAPPMLRASAIGGLVFGAASAVPLVGAINCACCALFIAAGFLAAYLYSDECKGAGVEFRPSTGASVGLIAAPFFAAAYAVVAFGFSFLFPQPDPDELIERIETMVPDIEPEALDIAVRVAEMFSGPLGLVFAFFFTLLLAAIFSTVGGLIGGAVFKHEPPSAEPPAAGPPPVTPADGASS